MFMEGRELQPLKAPIPILVTQDGISYFSKPTPARIRLLSFLLNNTLFSELYTGFDSSTIMEVRELQPQKTKNPILVTEEGMFMEVRELQLWKTPSPILVTEEGMFMEVRELQPSKAHTSILVTEEGMFMEGRELQSRKAYPSILVTEEGMFMEVRELKPLKAPPPILVTQDGISYFSKPAPARIRLLPFLLNNTLFSELYIGFDSSTVMTVRALQS